MTEKKEIPFKESLPLRFRRHTLVRFVAGETNLLWLSMGKLSKLHPKVIVHNKRMLKVMEKLFYTVGGIGKAIYN